MIKNPIIAGLCILIIMALIALQSTESPCELPDGSLTDECEVSK
jgi:hypothetical protein